MKTAVLGPYEPIMLTSWFEGVLRSRDVLAFTKINPRVLASIRTGLKAPSAEQVDAIARCFRTTSAAVLECCRSASSRRFDAMASECASSAAKVG